MLSKYFTKEYLLSGTGLFQSTDKIYFVISLILIALGLAFVIIRRFIKHPLRKLLLSRWLHMFWTIGILALLWSGLRQQRIHTISARVVALMLFLIGLVWVFFILKYHFVSYRRLRSEYEKEQLKRKYL